VTGRQLLHGTASAVGMPELARRAFRARPLVVCYHGVCGEKPDVPDLERMHVPATLFEEQIRTLARHYQPVSVQQLERHMAGDAELPSRAVLVTFDDGYQNVFENALPILKRYGIPCTLFLVAGLVGTERSIWTAELEWWQRADADLRDLKRCLKAMDGPSRSEALKSLLPSDARLPRCDSSLATWDVVRPWAGADVCIGSHGWTHESLIRCDDATLARELELSRSRLERELGIPVNSIAYPNGDHSPAVVEAAQRSGYSLAFTTVSRHLGRHDTRLTIPRILVGTGDQGPIFESRLSGWVEWLRAA
jgi:peptidoglycan/xylan/chitin deacetylase (PgdA/CDA1 family)